MTVPRTSPSEIGVVALCRWLLRYALRRRRGATVVVTTLLAKVGVDLLKPWPMKVLVDNALGDKPLPAWMVSLLSGAPSRQALLYGCVGATVVVFLTSWALGAVTAVSNVGFGQRLAYDLAGDLFAHFQRLSLRFHSRKPTGDSIRRVTSDTNAITTIVKDALLPALSSVVMLGTMLALLFGMNPQLAFVALVIIPLIAFALWRYSAPMARTAYHQQEVEGRMYDVVEQTLSSMPVVQAFTREESADRRYREATRESLAATLATTRVQYKYKIATGLGTALGTAAVLWLGAHQVLAQRLTLGELLVFLSYLASLYAPIEALAYTSSTIQSAAGSARRVMEVLQAEPEIRDRPHAVALSPIRGHVRFEDVSFGYEPGRPVLGNVSFEALPGQTIAVVGQTGAGKSTLMALIPRFTDPWQGRVTVDGHDLRDVQLRSLRSQIAIVLQEPLLFPITIAENIAYGRPGATRAEIEAAASTANADDFIRKLPDGYDTLVGQRGSTLSGGERQRISIARALLKDAPLLLLDEPTSALDAATEAALIEALRHLMVGRTTFVIAHRLSTIRHADRLLVVADGTVTPRHDVEEFVRAAGVAAGMGDADSLQARQSSDAS